MTKLQNELLSVLLMTAVLVTALLYGCSMLANDEEPQDYKKELCEGCDECELN
jgi:hypothetical protein